MKGSCSRILTLWGMLAVCAAALVPGAPAQAQTPEFRAFWIDAWHAGFKSAAECEQLVADLKTSNCNVAVAQMRRRADTYYPSQLEPFASDANPSFDALRYLLDRCHAQTPRIQVHAWLVLIPAWTSTTFPSNPEHPSNKYPQYLSRNNSGAILAEFDPGNPDCEKYLTDVVMELVNNYPDLDGISFDYSRFTNDTEGYNNASVARFNARYNRTGVPATTDTLWNQWRRDQLTNLMRRIYANAVAANPGICMSSAVVTWDPAPGEFVNTRPYYQVFQDWDGWMREGILDLSMPMAYFDRREQYAADYDAWMNFAKSHSYNRGTVIGPGIYMNSISNSIYQIRQTRDLYNGKAALGTVMYSYATTDDENNDGTGPDLPTSVFYNALSHTSSYDPNPIPVYSTPVEAPGLPWKMAPTKGHIKGAITACGSWIDGVTVILNGPETRTMLTDGTGFYAFIDLAPGSYTIGVTYNGETKIEPVTVNAGLVSTMDVDFCVNDPTPPVISDVQVANVTHDSALITWQTDDPSTGQVEYGATVAYGQATAVDASLMTSHAVLVSGLSASSTYHFRVRSANAMPLESYSGDYVFVTGPPPAEIILDNLDPEVTYTADNPPVWQSGTYAGGWPTSASEYAFVSNSRSSTTATCKWTPNIQLPGKYDVYVWFSSGSNRTTAARYTITHAGVTSSTIYVNQRDSSIASQWHRIATDLQFNVGTSGYVRLINRTGETSGTTVVMADAVKFVYVDSDSEAPTVPQRLQATAASTSTISLTWDASADNIGVIGYKVFRNGVLVGSPSTTSFSDTGLATNTKYTYTVSAYDGRLNESAPSSGVARYTLSLPPTDESITCDRTTGQWYATSPFTFGNGLFGPGKVNHYGFEWDMLPTHSWTGEETVWASGTQTVDATSGTDGWYFHVCGYNGDSIPNGTLDKGPYYYDGTPPGVQEVLTKWYLRKDPLEDLQADWTGYDAESGIAEYQYAIGTTVGATDILGWTSSGMSAGATYHYADALAHDYHYYFSIKAKDQAGNWSAPVNSHWSVYAGKYGTIAQAMNNPDATAVILEPMEQVTGNFGGFLYVQEADRSRGIRLDYENSECQPGTIASVSGRLATIDGERRLMDVFLNAWDAGPRWAKPLSTNISAIGGVAPDAYTPGFNGSGCYNLGLLLRTIGRVTAKGSGYFVLTDALGATVKVYSAVDVPDNALVGVTGVVGVEAGGRVLRTRAAEDVSVY